MGVRGPDWGPDWGPVEWTAEGTPRSVRFGDVYFSPGQGVAEGRHVFLAGCRLPDAWRDRPRFTIGELGFGTGLNFLLAWAAWRAAPAAARPANLDYVAVEGFPLARADLARALAGATADVPDLAPLAATLVAAWPDSAVAGFHPLDLGDGPRLLLLLGPVDTMLARLEARVDAWFLDGFAPARNPAMWAPPVFAALARLSAPGARLATFTAAGQVRRDLEAAGFRVERRPGFGAKRECLAAAYHGPPGSSILPPWFARPAPLPPGAPVLVIGAGVAGCAAARAVHAAGHPVTILDPAGRPGAEASGNACGLIKPRLTADGGIHGRFYALAYQTALAGLDRLAATGAPVWRRRGILAQARDPEEAAAMRRLAGTLPPADLAVLTAVEAAAVAGLPPDAVPLGGLWFPRAGAIDPRAVCAALADGLPLRAAAVAALERAGEDWLARDAAGAVIAGAAGVVIAAGPWAPGLWPAAALPIHANRGQVSLMPAPAPGRAAAVALSFGGYLSAPFSEAGAMLQVLGATYGRWPDLADEGWRAGQRGDHAAVLAGLAAVQPALAAAWAETPPAALRAGLRATVADHLPMVGPLFAAAAYRAAYGALHHGRPPASYPPAPLLPGLYLLGGLGSRGFQTAPLAAALVAALITGAPLPVEADLLTHLHPARFVIRALRRRPAMGAAEPQAGQAAAGW